MSISSYFRNLTLLDTRCKTRCTIWLSRSRDTASRKSRSSQKNTDYTSYLECRKKAPSKEYSITQPCSSGLTEWSASIGKSISQHTPSSKRGATIVPAKKLPFSQLPSEQSA